MDSEDDRVEQIRQIIADVSARRSKHRDALRDMHESLVEGIEGVGIPLAERRPGYGMGENGFDYVSYQLHLPSNVGASVETPPPSSYGRLEARITQHPFEEFGDVVFLQIQIAGGVLNLYRSFILGAKDEPVKSIRSLAAEYEIEFARLVSEGVIDPANSEK